MTLYRLPNKQPKPKVCVCGAKFIKEGIKPWHPYCSPACKLKHVKGHISEDQLTNYKHSDLMKIAKGVFDEYIRLRDRNELDITDLKSFKKGDKINASHLFPCNQYPGLMFNEDNCFASKEENNFLMGDREVWIRTAVNVAGRIKEERWKELKQLSESVFIRNYKYSNLELIETIKYFTSKIQEVKK